MPWATGTCGRPNCSPVLMVARQLRMCMMNICVWEQMQSFQPAIKHRGPGFWLLASARMLWEQTGLCSEQQRLQ